MLGGEVRELTLIFSDVRNFTTISEGISATRTDGVHEQSADPDDRHHHRDRGTIDKYMGDAIMAFWNAPLDDAEHAAPRLRGRAGDAAAAE